MLGYDLVGVAQAVGSEVSGIVPGDRVVAITRWGANADEVLVAAPALTRLNTSLDAVQIEPMVMTGATAAAMVRRLAPVRPGQAVFVQGASGGVGVIAAQAALLLGARVLGSAAPAKHAALAALGIEVLDHRQEGLAAELLRRVPGGVDLVLDAAGGVAIDRAAGALADGGTLVSFGFAAASRQAAGRTPEVLAANSVVFEQSARALEAINASSRGLSAMQFDITGLREQAPDAYTEDLHWLLAHVEAGRLGSLVDAVALENVAEVHRALDAGEVTGRIVLDHRRDGTGR